MEHVTKTVHCFSLMGLREGGREGGKEGRKERGREKEGRKEGEKEGGWEKERGRESEGSMREEEEGGRWGRRKEVSGGDVFSHINLPDVQEEGSVQGGQSEERVLNVHQSVQGSRGQ